MMGLSRALVAAAVLVILTAPLAGAGTTTKWYPDDGAHGSVSSADVMYQDDPDGPSALSKVLASGDCVLWAADQSADVDVPFDKSGWTGPIEAADGSADTTASSGTYTIELGVVDTGGSFSSNVGPADVDFAANGPDEDVGEFTTSESGTFSVPTGSYLGAEFCNNDDAKITLQTDGSSQIDSPSDQPAYPTPELPTIALSLAGLFGLALVGRQRRD